jgi:hypothetical protein
MASVNPFVLTDIRARAQEQITQQFQDKVVFGRYVDLLLAGEQEALLLFQALMQARSIDTAVGEQLNILGRIVGQDRVLIGADATKFFGFQGTTLSSTFGTTTNSAVGGYWYSAGAPVGGNVTLDDSQYKTFIKAKIKKNVADASVDGVLEFLSFVFNLKCTVTANGGGEATILLNRKLSDFERALVDGQDASGSWFVPRPLGVRLIIEEPNSDGTLGFLGTPPPAMGMISITDIAPNGGIFGTVLVEE